MCVCWLIIYVFKVLMVFVFDVERAVGSKPNKVGRYQKKTKEYSRSQRNYNLLL